MDDLQFYVLFNSISVKSRCGCNNERLSAMEPNLRLERFQHPAGLEPVGTLPEEVTLGPVVQSIVSLTSLLRGQLVKCFTSL